MIKKTMTKELEIKNFKSIKDLKLDCKRINIFIGKPNTGKSNILESFGIFQLPYSRLKDFIRFENMHDLFFDHDLSEKIDIINRGTESNIHCGVVFKNGKFMGVTNFSYLQDKSIEELFRFDFDYQGGGGWSSRGIDPFYKFYRFAVLNSFPNQRADFLVPPRGENLLSILLTNKNLKKMAWEIFSDYGFKIVLEPQENQIKIQKESEGVLVSHPYSLVSDTLQRVIFHLVAIETNEDSVIIFEEPEAHSFPYYTKFLAERIALSKTNQFFISTHNPYFLLSLIEKSKKEDLNVVITYFKDYQTKVKPLNEKEMEEVIDKGIDIFFNLDRFLEEE